jgi:hypothetical protein
MRLPIGIQDFRKLREDDYIYVDKTMFMQPFVEGGVYFLSRPRRFGKSLFLSTLKAVFEGRQELFKGLWLEHHHDFKPRPVIRLDFSNINFTDKTINEGVVDWLKINAAEFDLELFSTNARDAFREMILALSKDTKVVVLIDEYDKPITDNLFEPEKRLEHQNVLKSLYGVLKPLDANLHLVVFTGVSKIGKLSLFSDLNNLSDISMNPKYATMLGYSREEIELSFPAFLEQLSDFQKHPLEELWVGIKRWYNGYSWDAVNRLYCPFSFLLFLENKEFRSFWYETGTPTFLLEMIRNAHINPLEFDATSIDGASLSSTDVLHLDPISLMFQTGYLTIKSIDRTMLSTQYELGYPNEEVRIAFSKHLLQQYGAYLPSTIGGFSIKLQRALVKLEWNVFFEIVNQIFAGIPYEIFPKQESYVHSLMHLMLISTGFQTASQVQTSLGRMDTFVQTFEYSIIFEFKIGGTPGAALAQIEEKRYADALEKPIIKVGVVFDLETKSISGWAIG